MTRGCEWKEGSRARTCFSHFRRGCVARE